MVQLSVTDIDKLFRHSSCQNVWILSKVSLCDKLNPKGTI